MTAVRRVAAKDPWSERWGYARAIRTGDRIEVSGTTPIDADGGVIAVGDPEAQMRAAIVIVEQALAELGAGLGDVVRTRVFLRDVEDWEAAGRAHRAAFGAAVPASSCIGGAEFLHPEILVAVEATAVAPPRDQAGGAIVGVNHAGVVVSDVERSLGWYRDVLGLELVARQRQDNPYTCQLVGLDDAVLEVAELRVPGATGGPLVELIEYVRPRGGAVRAATNDVGASHLAFAVRDLRALYARLAAHGVAIPSGVVEITEGVNRGGLTCYLADPDGNGLELFEPPCA